MIMYFITVFRLFTVHMVHFYFLLLAIRKLLIFLDFSAVFFLTLLFLFLTSFLGVLHLGLGREGFLAAAIIVATSLSVLALVVIGAY